MDIRFNEIGVRTRKDNEKMVKNYKGGYKLVKKPCNELINEIHHLRNEYENLIYEYRRRYLNTEEEP